MKKKCVKRILTLLISFTLILTLLPFSMVAQALPGEGVDSGLTVRSGYAQAKLEWTKTEGTVYAVY